MRVVFVCIALAAAAADERSWPTFGGSPSRNMVNLVEKDPPTDWSVEKGKEKNVKWVAELGTVAYGGPTVGDGKVFVATNNENPRNPRDNVKGQPADRGVVMCFRASDGQFLWQAVHDKLPDGEKDYPKQGIASTPAVDGKRVYYVSNRCEVICADTEGFLDGKNDGVQDEQYRDKTDADVVWRLDMHKELGVTPYQLCASSPLVVGDLVYVVTSNGIELGQNQKAHVVNPKAPSLIAIDKHTGKVKWQDASHGDAILQGEWSNPTYAEVNGKGQVIYGGGDGWLRGLDALTGKPIWKFDCNPKVAVWKQGGGGTRSYVVATPVVYENRAYVGVGIPPDLGSPGVGHLWCVDITKTGDLSPVKDNFDPKAEVNKDSGLVWHYGGMVVPRPKDGRDMIFGHTISTCAIHDGLLYAAEMAGYLHCLDARTGKPYWVYDLKSGVWSSPYWVDGKVYLGNDSGDLFIFAHGKEQKLLGKIDMDEPVLSTPAVVGGVLYVATKSKLYAIGKK